MESAFAHHDSEALALPLAVALRERVLGAGNPLRAILALDVGKVGHVLKSKGTRGSAIARERI